MIKKKNNGKPWNVVLPIIGAIALFLLVTALWSELYGFIADNSRIIIFISSIILLVLLFLGVTSWKKIKKKIKGIFQ